jgi:hypothetical protein
MKTQVNYEVTTKEVIDSYLYMIRNSNPYRNKILTYAVLVLVIPISIHYMIYGTVTLTAVFYSLGLMALFPLTLVYLARAIAKKGEKKIVVSDVGMEVTVSGKWQAIGWEQVAELFEDNEHLIVLAKTGNFMCIPKRAFKDSETLETFKKVVAENA